MLEILIVALESPTLVASQVVTVGGNVGIGSVAQLHDDISIKLIINSFSFFNRFIFQIKFIANTNI